MKKVLHISIYPEKWMLYSKKWWVASYTKNLITSVSISESEMSIFCDIDSTKEMYWEWWIQVIRWRRSGILSIWDIFWYLFRSIREYSTVHVQHELNLFWSTLAWYIILLMPLFFPKMKRILTSHHAVDYKDIDADFVKNHGQILPVFIVKFAFRVLYSMYKLRDWIIVHEQIHSKRLNSQYWINWKAINVIPHGVESKVPVNKELAKHQLWIKSNDNIIFYMWYVTGYKDLRILIEWYASWLKSNPESVLILWAWPEKKSKNNPLYMKNYQSLIDLASQLIPEDNYRRLWFIASEELSAYYSASDVLVLPYRYTLSASWPMAIAIAYWLPFLASECFSEYFLDYPDCIFKFSSSGLDVWLTSFFENIGNRKAMIYELQNERLYSELFRRTSHLYI